MKNLIGLAGLARAGKDTVASRLHTHHEMDRRAFADPLKVMTAVLAGEPLNRFYDDAKKEEFSETLGMTRRKAMQLMGTEMIRKHFGPDHWHKLLLTSWRERGCPATVVSDVRFDNEAEAIRAAGGIIVRVTRPSAGLSGENAQHASEAGVSDHLVDFVLDNSGDYTALFEKVDALVAILKEA